MEPIYHTNQEIFDAVWRGLESQGWQTSATPDGKCKYRHRDGRKCAAGWLIPDELYDPIMEGKGAWATGGSKYPGEVLASLMGPDAKATLVEELQEAHDKVAHPRDSVTDLRSMIANVGRKRNLIVPGD